MGPTIHSKLEPSRWFADIIEERRGGPPRNPSEAAASFIYVLARELLRREARPDRAERVVRDFEDAARELEQAAETGASRREQQEILQKHWRRLKLPERDHRKRKEKRGRTDTQLLEEIDALRAQLSPILRDRENKSRKAIIQQLRQLAPWATERTLKEAARSRLPAVAQILIASRYHLARHTVQNRISKASKRA